MQSRAAAVAAVFSTWALAFTADAHARPQAATGQTLLHRHHVTEQSASPLMTMSHPERSSLDSTGEHEIQADMAPESQQAISVGEPTLPQPLWTRRFKDADEDRDDRDCRSFTSQLRIVERDGRKNDRFVVRGSLDYPRGRSRDIDPESEPVVLRLGELRFMIPAGAFNDVGDRSEFEGSVDGTDLRMVIRHDRDEGFSFVARGSDVDLDDLDKPVRVGLRIGRDRWCDRTEALIREHRDGKDDDDRDPEFDRW